MMRSIARPANITFLTDRENACLEHLLEAVAIFEELTMEQPQSTSDSYNFGHYVEAAVNAVIMRGARRLDQANLLPKSAPRKE